MKKLIALLLVLAMVFTLAACGNPSTNPTEPTKGTEQKDPTDGTQQKDPTDGNDPTDGGNDKGEGVMTYAEYAAAATDDPVVVECYVQAHQSWWDNKITVYAQDQDGAYFMYNMACSEEDAAKLVPGTKIRVSGFKAAFQGEVEIIDATFEILEGSWIAEPTDVTALLDSEDLINYQNILAAIKGAKVVASTDGDGNEVAFLYKWNGSGTAGDDLYFNIEVGGKVYNMCVESYLTGDGTEVYDAVEALQIGDVIDLTGFLYWYNTVNPHVVSVTVSE